MYRIALFLLTTLHACNNVSESKEIDKPKETPQRITLTQLRLIDMNDQPIDLEKHKGKTLFINFWATWCKPCREEMPSIQEAMKILKGEKIEFLFASDETKEQIDKFQKTHSYGFKYVRVENMDELGIMGLPTTFIFNPSGELVFSEMGYRKWDDKSNIDLILNIIKLK